MTSKQAVVFIFVDMIRKIALLERRRANQTNPGQTVFPGGGIEVGDNSAVELAMLREVKEELGVEPINYAPVPTKRAIFDRTGKRLHLFVITKWKGAIPKKVLDKGNPIRWRNLDRLAETPIKTHRIIVAALLDFLPKLSASKL